MPLLRLLLAGLVALAAMAAVLFTAVVVMITGLAAYLMHWFRHGSRPAPARPPNHGANRPTDDVIDVVATDVPDKPPGT